MSELGILNKEDKSPELVVLEKQLKFQWDSSRLLFKIWEEMQELKREVKKLREEVKKNK